MRGMRRRAVRKTRRDVDLMDLTKDEMRVKKEKGD
jgi:hypothetical protein